MSASSTTFIPLHALTVWADDHDIFVSIPTAAGSQPYISKYPLTEGGLSKAISILKVRRKELAPKHVTKFTEQESVRRVSNFTETQRENARRVLRKLRIVAE